MEKLKQLAIGMNHRFPEGDDAFQITTRLLEECGEVAKEVNRLEKSGTKVLRHGNGTKEDLASEIKDAMNALMQLAIHYDAVEQVQASIEKSIEQLTREGHIKGDHGFADEGESLAQTVGDQKECRDDADLDDKIPESGVGRRVIHK